MCDRCGPSPIHAGEKKKKPSNEDRNDPHHVFRLPQESGPCFRPDTSSSGLDPDQDPGESKAIILFLTDVFLTLTLTKFLIKT